MCIYVCVCVWGRGVSFSSPKCGEIEPFDHQQILMNVVCVLQCYDSPSCPCVSIPCLFLFSTHFCISLMKNTHVERLHRAGELSHHRDRSAKTKSHKYVAGVLREFNNFNVKFPIHLHGRWQYVLSAVTVCKGLKQKSLEII